ncbi:hypothetical protein SAMN05660653_01650 [Desulfonatronum thiosulfatophilum]|uniref:Uncharacterized protein n=1 Tax=Desulfonatronum thiosulfatophilum TaxID=617002 RepID=A0A1G6CNG8_9BACT|nr:hypothetical protein [Desulfonatronum thiosulfatophilum]SDB34285.1 hypothetical protein SAMN05660653_01650 [Desulfonatronum thiosulfatophilum]
MHHNNSSPVDFKSLTQSLRTLPVAPVPGDLSERIMAALPRRRGRLGSLEVALTRDLAPKFSGSNTKLLPSTPGEFGITTFIAGFFFFLLGLVFVIVSHSTGMHGILAHALFALSPALLGSILLVIAGLVQIKSPQVVVQQNARFAVACSLFSLSATIGLVSGGHYLANLSAALLGLSGLLIALGLFSIPKFSLFTREVYCERKPFTA